MGGVTRSGCAAFRFCLRQDESACVALQLCSERLVPGFREDSKIIGQVASLVDRRRTFRLEGAGQRNRSFLSERILDPYSRGDLSSHELDSSIDMICI